MFESMKTRLKDYRFKIVFPEGTDSRILSAAVRLHQENIITPIVLGNRADLEKKAEELGLNLTGVTSIDPTDKEMIDEMTPIFIEKRKGKVNEANVSSILQDVNYFGTMLVEMGKADGLVSGAVHSTANTVRPALQIIKTKPGVQKISGVIFLFKNEKRFIFADCAINVNPSAEDLAEIAVETAETARTFGLEPRVAMLSFSSHGSGQAIEAFKVAEATAIVKEREPSLVVDGEIQFDAAISLQVAKQKVPGSPLEGNANVFIFPTIDAGNIGYKIAQRLGGLEAIGPVLQGLNKPVNDLSRGCTEDDVYGLALITADQCIAHVTVSK